MNTPCPLVANLNPRKFPPYVLPEGDQWRTRSAPLFRHETSTRADVVLLTMFPPLPLGESSMIQDCLTDLVATVIMTLLLESDPSYVKSVCFLDH